MIRPLSNVSLTTNLLVVLATFAVGGFFVLLQLPPGGSGGIAAVTTRGGQMVIVRYPKPPTGPQLQIVVFDSATLATPRLAVLAAADACDIDLSRAVQLAPSQWQALDELRQQWCAAPPHFPSAASAAPIYAIGLRCENSNHGMPRAAYLRVLGDALPASVQDLIARFPQPAQ
ncbi:hypothetical protein EKD04_014535 [Chloroflexales bacterium ZM16-3]|nr:hypothetical protein [Chloroflexales bacterium ZM16-3]